MNSDAASGTVPGLCPSVQGDPDTGIGRAGADLLSMIAGAVEGARCSKGVAGQSDGLTALRPVDVDVSSPVTINGTVADSRKVYSNLGAGGAVTYNLPGAAAGLEFIFCVQAAQNMVVDAAAGDVIQIAGSASTSGGTATNNVIGSTLHLIALDATNWFSIGAPTGTWSLA